MGASRSDPSAALKIKVEVNTHETSPVLPPVRLPFAVETEWFTGRAEVKTFVPEELIATKIRRPISARRAATCSTCGSR